MCSAFPQSCDLKPKGFLTKQKKVYMCALHYYFFAILRDKLIGLLVLVFIYYFINI